MVTRTEYHTETAADFLARARAYLAADDLLQASEKGWGATARSIKAVTESRGWNHGGHRRLHDAVDLLEAKTGRADLRDGFNAGNVLHANFYDGFLTADGVRANLERVERFVELMRSLTLS